MITTHSYDVDATVTVYRDDHYCGMVFAPCLGGHSGYIASAWRADIPLKTFANQGDAVNYLVEVV